jgi:hypothetical protein
LKQFDVVFHNGFPAFLGDWITCEAQNSTELNKMQVEFYCVKDRGLEQNLR